MRVIYTLRFLSQLEKASDELVEEVHEAIEKFKIKENHKALKVHNLKGELKELYAFSVNYKIRILFYYPAPDIAHLIAFGQHDEVYR